MQFLKSVWQFLVGVKDALVLIFLLLLFGGLWAAFSMSSPKASVPSGAALLIDLDGVLVDQASSPSILASVAGQTVIPETDAATLVKTIDLAAKDDNIRMIALDLDGFMGGGQANLESVGAALTRFRAAGKQVESWATAYSDDSYLLAAHANRIGVSPMGAVMIAGPGGNRLYFKEALDKLKVDVEVFRVGTYKSFVEPYTRTGASPEAKAADQALADDLWARWRAVVQAQRKGLDVAATIASWPARIAGANRSQAELAKDAGYVDAVLTGAQWHENLRKTLGEGDDPDVPGDFKRVDSRDYYAIRQPLTETGPAVGIVHVTGGIVDGEAPPGQAGGATVAGLIRHAVADGDVQALVVRIDSGGGSAVASDEIRQAMLEAKAAGLPVVASFGPVAASGGYWVGSGADTIFASPSTITGSIGVFGMIPTFGRTLANFGVHSDGVATTPFSGQPDVTGSLNDPTRALIQGQVQDIYRQFVAIVAQSRKLPVAEVEKIAEGRVWSGTRAKELKLIDQFGDLDAAVAEAGRQAKISGKPRVKVMQPPEPLLMQVLNRLFGAEQRAPGSDALATAVAASRLKAAAQVAEATEVASGASVQANCLGCSAWSVPAPRPPKETNLAALAMKRLLD